MSVYDIGRVCVKTTGREAGRYCVVVDIIVIDGLNVRRRRTNYKHLEPISETIDIKKGASHDKIEEAIKKAKLEKKLKETISIPIK
jgi:large subunit ribosomal protein L14e